MTSQKMPAGRKKGGKVEEYARSWFDKAVAGEEPGDFVHATEGVEVSFVVEDADERERGKLELGDQRAAPSQRLHRKCARWCGTSLAVGATGLPLAFAFVELLPLPSPGAAGVAAAGFAHAPSET